MPTPLSVDVAALLNDGATIKVLSTTDRNGVPHVVFKGSLHAAEDGTIHLLELLESSRTGRNLIAGLWFDRTVAIALKGADGRTVQIKGRPVRNLIAGPVFQKHYAALREHRGDVDLAGVWVIEPDEVIDQSFTARRAAEEKAHPTFIHLDRIARH